MVRLPNLVSAPPLACLDVLGRGQVEVLLDVVEGVLGKVGHTRVGVLPDGAAAWQELAREELDERGLASSVGTSDGDTGGERHVQRNVVERVLVAALQRTDRGDKTRVGQR